ncbi:hypothetical protein ACFQH1_02170 [Lactiplantibacillus daoliensis]|uniref:Uncharacterized protein n=1 Tax=Lactiplantibacillus daoliensis TaxID=2559916 RepID=A0ABW1UDV5_9LACO|nr:hypothetical protein [Lactiplantibacillus daoliensis]
MLNRNGRLALGIAGLIEIILLFGRWSLVLTILYTIGLTAVIVWLNQKQRQHHDDHQ